MIKVLFIFAILVAAVAAYTEKQYQEIFTNWMHQYKKSYQHDEFHVRYQTFKSNLDFVTTFNADPSHKFQVGINKFADLSNKEFSSIYLGFKQPAKLEGPIYKPKNIKALPPTWDWRQKGAVTPIKNQGQCGSCWSFSTTGSTEGCHFISKNTLVALSEQNLMDCSYSQGDQSCEGGLMTDAMNYIISNGGIDTEASYPYQGVDESSCNYTVANLGATLSSYSNIPSGSEADLQTSVYQGPVSVAIDASQTSFQLYQSGVYSDPNCSSQQLDHGVLAIGWGTDTGQAYWLVKNSWGTDWGMSGYIEMARNDNNMCGIATMATLPEC